VKILVVDDDQHIVDLLPVILRNVGFNDVTCHTSATRAFAGLLSATASYDCIILDIDMPDIDGIELCRRIRNVPGYKEVPIIMLTGRRDETSLTEAFEAGATDYVTKPFDVLQIGVRIKLSAKLVRAQHAINYLRLSQQTQPEVPLGNASALTRKEVVNIFCDDLYPADPLKKSKA